MIAACNDRQSVVLPALDGPFTKMMSGQRLAMREGGGRTTLPTGSLGRACGTTE